MALLAIVAFGIPLALSMRDRVDGEVRSHARSQADVVAATASDLLSRSDRDRLDRLVATAARSVRGRVLIVDANGIVLADSAGPAEAGTSYRPRPEIASALAGDVYQRTRHSDTLNTDLLATAVPIVRSTKVIGSVRVTQDVAAVQRAVNRTTGGLALIGLVVLALGLIAAVLLARGVALPMQRLTTAARRIAGGDMDARAPVEGSAEQRDLAQSFNEMTDRLAEALAGQKRFVADASHQLRTPLTGLRLRLEEAEAAPQSAAEDVRAAMSEVDRLAGLVDELLLLSRAENGGGRPEALDTAALADDAVDRWSTIASDRNVHLRRGSDRHPATGASARADADRALDALVENAILYSAEGGEVEVSVDGRTVRVLDRGPGLAPGEEDEVFERFHRGYAGRKGPSGTGLGLAIARRLARRWGGDAALANRDDGGAEATLTLQQPATERTKT
jgi:signal transduction histidine kinase